MQENNPTPTPEITTPVAVEQPKQSNFLVILLTILLLISVAISGFFAYQTQELVKELNKLKTIEKTVAEDMSEPVATESSGIDPTADWKTFTNTEFNFSFKYPDTGTVKEIVKRDEMLIGGSTFSLNYNDGRIRPQASEIYVNVYDSKNMDLSLWLSTNSTTKSFGSDENKEYFGYTIQGGGTVDALQAVKFKNDVMGFVSHNIAVKKDNYIFVIGNVEVSEDLSTTYNQILSTFKFLE